MTKRQGNIYAGIGGWTYELVPLGVRFMHFDLGRRI